MRDGQGCLLPVLTCPRQLLLADDLAYIVPCLLSKPRWPDVTSYPPAKANYSDSKKKARRVKLKCVPKTIQIEDKVCTEAVERPIIDFTTQVRRKAACQSTQENADHNEDNSFLPGLDDESALRCLAFVSRADHGKLARLSKRYLELVHSSLLFELRRRYGVVEQWVCMYTNGNIGWTAFDPKRNAWMSLPPTETNPNFNLSDRESLSAGTHLLWVGREAFDFACYRYDLVTNSWDRGPSMVNSRCLFASASCGEFGYVAGGFGAIDLNLLSSAERYDSRLGRWDPLPPMKVPRQKCSGLFMDGKFYVIGGKDSQHVPLTSGEEYDPIRKSWRTIENMYPTAGVTGFTPPPFEGSPPLVAVARNELYAIDSVTNLLKFYEKATNTWKILGPVPVRADSCNGWGYAFKALGDELFVIGKRGESNSSNDDIAIFSCRPQPETTAPDWQLVTSRVPGTGNFLFNCAVMAC